MKAVILAAGRGRRLAPMGWDKPKCLLPCGEGTLLSHTLQVVAGNQIREVVMVVGHQRESVEQAARRHPLHCEFVVNRDYAVTNTIHSLWLAREHLDAGMLYINGDVWFASTLLTRLLHRSGSALAVEEKRCGPEEVKVQADASGRIRRIGKHLPANDAMGEFIGVAKFDRALCSTLIESLRRYNDVLGQRDRFFEAALDDILEQHAVMADPLEEGEAMEIDTPEDYARAKSLWIRRC